MSERLEIFERYLPSYGEITWELNVFEKEGFRKNMDLKSIRKIFLLYLKISF